MDSPMAKLASRSRNEKPVAMFCRARFSSTLLTRYQPSSATQQSTRIWKKIARAFGSLIRERRGARGAGFPRFLEIANDHSFPGLKEAPAPWREAGIRIGSDGFPGFVLVSGRPSPVRLQRAGGAYIRPPLVHSAFSPRSSFSGVLTPTLRSKISP